MTADYLLMCLAEECNKVAQRACNAMRFGINEVQPDQRFTNAQRIVFELCDLFAVVDLLKDSGQIEMSENSVRNHIAAKKEKIEKFMQYSKECGVIQ